MAQQVLALVRVHPVLQPLRDAGETVCVACHAHAVWAHTLADSAGRYVEARIEDPTWWEPRLNTAEDRAIITLANRLAVKLREKWKAR